MDWIHRSVGDVGARQARRSVSVILMAAGIPVLAMLVACTHATATSQYSPNPVAGNSGPSACPSQGGDSAPPLCASPATSTTPPIAGPVTVTGSPPSPQVTAISPASGSADGGDSVTISGGNLSGASEVDFGGVRATFTIDSDTEITATSPPGSGTVDVTVVAPAGTTATSPADQFTYQG